MESFLEPLCSVEEQRRADVFRIRLLVGTVGLALAWTGTATAQQIPNAGQILRQTQPPPSPAKPPPRIELGGARTKPAMRPEAGPSVVVKAFRFTGVTAFKTSQLQALLADRIGKQLGFSELQAAANAITLHYREHGYFAATAYLPAQQIEHGVVEITVVEGHLGKIKLMRKFAARLKAEVARGYLDRIPVNQPLKERDVERALLLLNDLPGITVSGVLQPGKRPGTGDLNVQIREGNLVTGSVGFDNAGAPSSGEDRMSVGVNLNDPTGRGDRLSLTGLQTQGGGVSNAGVAYVVPVNSLGTKAEFDYNALHYRLGKEFAALRASGRAQVADAKLSHSFVRSRGFDVLGQVGVEGKSLEDRIDATNSVSDKMSRNVSLRLTADKVDDWLGGGASYLALTYTRGQLDLNTPSVRAQDAGPNGYQTQGSFAKWNYSLTRQQNIAYRWSWYAAVNGQSASKNLDSSEKFTLGGPYGVRAYPVAEAAADEGVVANMELRYILPQTLLPGQWMVLGFVDAGRARINKNPLPTDTNNVRVLHANGIGLDWTGYKGVDLRSSLAWGDSGQTDGGSRDPRLYLQMSMGF